MASKPKDDGSNWNFDPEIAELLVGRNHQIGYRPVARRGLALTKSRIEPVNPKVQKVVSMLLRNLKKAQKSPPA